MKILLVLTYFFFGVDNSIINDSTQCRDQGNAQPQTNQYVYVYLFEAFASLKRVLKWSCLNASKDIMGAPIMSILLASASSSIHAACPNRETLRLDYGRELGLLGCPSFTVPYMLFPGPDLSRFSKQKTDTPYLVRNMVLNGGGEQTVLASYRAR